MVIFQTGANTIRIRNFRNGYNVMLYKYAYLHYNIYLSFRWNGLYQNLSFAFYLSHHSFSALFIKYQQFYFVFVYQIIYIYYIYSIPAKCMCLMSIVIYIVYVILAECVLYMLMSHFISIACKTLRYISMLCVQYTHTLCT